MVFFMKSPETIGIYSFVLWNQSNGLAENLKKSNGHWNERKKKEKFKAA